MGIGCCYDGEKIFNLLQSKDVNTSISLFKDEKKMWEITKRYTNELFNDDETSIGYPIDVYQESINKTFREYLVNFKYLKRLMENYGFILLEPEDLKKFDLKSSLNNFEELYYNMMEDIKKNKKIQHNFGKAIDMSDEEKQISFMNTYFIFKKIRNVNHKEIQESSPDKINMEDETGLLDEEMIEQQQQQEQEEEVSEQDKIDNDVQNIDDEIEKLNNLSIKEKATMIADEYMKEKEKEEKEKEKTAKEKTAKEKTAKEKTAKEKTVKEKTAKEKTVKEKPEKENPTKEKTAKEKTAKEKTAKEKTAKEKTTKENPAKENPAKENPAKEKTAKENPAKEKTAKEKTAKEKPAKEKTDKPKSSNKELTDEEILKIKDKIRKVKLESKD